MKVSWRVTSIALFAGAALAVHLDLAAQPDVSLADVLERLGTYLANYSAQLSRTVATERYKQVAGSGNTRTETLLESEFGIVKVPDFEGWLGFRDVLKVNGRPVQDHESRLQDLLLNPSPLAISQARRITEESARFNIGIIQRNINNPALMLEMFDRRNHPRFHFTKVDEETIDSTRVWVIRYEERATPSIVKTPEGHDIPTVGRAWVEPISGALVRAEVNVINFVSAVGAGASKAQTRVYFKQDPKLRFWVPERLTERYDAGGIGPVTGDATYSNYRQFGTETHEDFVPPDK